MTSALMPKIARPDGPVLGMRRSYRTGGKFVGGGMSCNNSHRGGDQCPGSSDSSHGWDASSTSQCLCKHWDVFEIAHGMELCLSI